MNMPRHEIVIDEGEGWKTRTLLIGAALGAVVGLGAAYLLVQRTENGRQPSLTTGDGVRIGLLVLGLLRQVAEMGEGEKKK